LDAESVGVSNGIFEKFDEHILLRVTVGLCFSSTQVIITHTVS